MKRLLFLALVLTCLSGWWMFVRPVSMGGSTGYIIVSGRSMEPTYSTGDLVLVRKRQHYRVGDVVAFRVKDGTVIHRIVSGEAASGFITQGDNNDWLDTWKDGRKPTNDDIVGSEWLVIRGGSTYLNWSQRQGVLPALLGFFFTVGAFGARNVVPRRRSLARSVFVTVRS